jgi:hypothetical protein
MVSLHMALFTRLRWLGNDYQGRLWVEVMARGVGDKWIADQRLLTGLVIDGDDAYHFYNPEEYRWFLTKWSPFK